MKVIFFFWILIYFFLSLRVCRLLYFLKVVIVIKKIVLKVKCFKDVLVMGLKGVFCNICRILGKFYLGINLILGGLELNIFFKSLMIYGCWFIEIFFIGGKIDDNIDLYFVMVLYWRFLV